MKRYCCYPDCKNGTSIPLDRFADEDWEAVSWSGGRVAVLCPTCCKKEGATDLMLKEAKLNWARGYT